MTAARDRRASRLLDPRWLWLADAADRIYAELDDDQVTAGLTLIVVGADGVMAYSVLVGRRDVTRMAVTDLGAIAAAAAHGLTDATPPSTIGDLT